MSQGAVFAWPFLPGIATRVYHWCTMTRRLISVAFVGSWLLAACGGIQERDCPNGNCATSCTGETYLSGGVCVPFTVCEAGSYVAEPGTGTSDQVCAACPSGAFSSQPNSPSCSTWRSCQPGTFVTNVPSMIADRACASCNAGTYTDGINQSVCLTAAQCPAGTVETTALSATAPRACIPCSSGEYCAGGSAAAVACPASTWDDDADPATLCVARSTCAAGTYATQPGAPTRDRSCSPCPSGTMTATENQTSCWPWVTCPAGTYVANSPGPSTDRQCVACPADTYTTGENQSVCLSPIACPAGTVLVTESTPSAEPECIACSKGVYCPGGESPGRACAGDTWDHDGNPATACVTWTSCMAGEFIAIGGSTVSDQTCLPCPSGAYSSTWNSPSCTELTDCTPGTYVAAPGTDQSDRVCVPCSEATFSATVNQFSCEPWSSCPANTTFVDEMATPWSDIVCSPCSRNGCEHYCTQNGTCIECISHLECPSGLACAEGSCQQLACGTHNYFTESFLSGNAQWWTLKGAWDIGPAVAWSSDPDAGAASFEDPADDHSTGTDQMLAGVAIGGPVPADVMTGPAYLTSAAIDTSAGPSPVYLEFASWLSADAMPLMNHSVEVYDGTQWVVLWSGPDSTPVSEHAWQYQKYDVTAYRNERFMVRFGYQVRDPYAERVGSWSIDDVRIANTPSCSD